MPGTVTNIRAYVYKPTRGSDDLTALVLWDEPDFVVSNYIMSVFDVNNVELYPSVSDKGYRLAFLDHLIFIYCSHKS